VARARRRDGGEQQQDLFAASADPHLSLKLGAASWPPAAEFPVNHSGGHVRDQVWVDLTSSTAPFVVAGFASIAKIIELVAAASRKPEPGQVRILLGTEPFPSERAAFGSPSASFTEEVRRFWIEEQGVSLLLSAKIVQALEALDAGWLEVRFVPGRTRLHAKIFIGDQAATIGSSNFTDAGLSTQFEANVRFDKTTRPGDYAAVRLGGENYWDVGISWGDEFRAMLLDMLRFVTWQEALARACADLLDGQWAAGYLGATAGISRLWPSQVAGIAEALWIVENVGSVLVADATGSGKTRMGAHLTRAVRDRLWNTGRVRRDLTVLVCPPAVEEQWRREAVSCGLTLQTVSHGLLSRKSIHGRRVQEDEVASAQILAIDEAHNFLAPGSNRSHQVRDSAADHVLMFTATPINRGAEDLLSLVDQLGADNFEDETLAVLDHINRRRSDWILTDSQKELLRSEIQRFTVRRTKNTLNAMVDERPEDYRHPETGRICRYPEHQSSNYSVGESAAARRVADEIRLVASELQGVTSLGPRIHVPEWLRREYDDERWLNGRLAAARGLASHHVRSGMRSSQAALLEHVAGTEAATERLGITGLIKQQPTGNMIEAVRAASSDGPPQIDLACAAPPWLTHVDAWQAACQSELDRYRRLADLALELGCEREQAKAAFVVDLAMRHQRVLAFDHHPITLAVIRSMVQHDKIPVLVATGAAKQQRRRVRDLFARNSTEPGIALCSDAMNEGINLQGASVIVHFDMPTTLRVAEQRVGRVDRMDSPYDRIEVWWPDDSPSFATRANELLVARNNESSALLGSNLPIPGAQDPDAIVTGSHFDQAARESQSVWDGLHDALDPVRTLVTGPQALIPTATYEKHRGTRQRVLARISPVRTSTAWAFFAIRGAASGAPRWILLEESSPKPMMGLTVVTSRLRELLTEDPPSASFDDACERHLTRFLERATRAEIELLPKRLQRALAQMQSTCRHWADTARISNAYTDADRWELFAAVTAPDSEMGAVDLHQAAELWLQLVQPLRLAVRTAKRRARYSRLSDIDKTLRAEPLPISDVEQAFAPLRLIEPLDQRVASCILGVPA
jgi:superfamily II DNA or RNA helicase